jgi:hypothetical protein
MRPSDGRFSLWPAAIIGIVLLIAALSITPAVQLKSAPPSDFAALRPPAALPKTALAGGYWEVATRVIQWKYSRTSPLPAQVPADFKLAAGNGKPDRIEDQGTRAAYWAKLREEWLRPENWHTTYGVDLTWPVKNARNLSRMVMQFIHQS